MLAKSLFSRSLRPLRACLGHTKSLSVNTQSYATTKVTKTVEQIKEKLIVGLKRELKVEGEHFKPDINLGV